MAPRSTRSAVKKEPKESKDGEEKDAGEKRRHDEVDGDTKREKKENDEPPRKAAKTGSGSEDKAIQWLLSDEAFDLANPEIPTGHGEIDWQEGDSNPPKKAPPPADAGKKPSSKKGSAPKGKKGEEIIRYPHSHLSPFQNLVAACLLSKPISHTLGLRTIQTLLNPPFGLRTLKDLDEAGYEGLRKVMWEARTQHKEKTAGQLGDVVKGIQELCDAEEGDAVDQMTPLREEIKGCKDTKGAAERVEEKLTKIKGIGPGVAAIFLRRVQGDWGEVFPFADDKSLAAAKELGLIDGKEGAKELAEKVNGDKGKFVRLLDTLIGLSLEKKMDEAKEKVGR